MAHAAVKNPNARVLEQCTQGRFIRNVVCKGLRIDTNRATIIVADVIKSETAVIPFFVAPCAEKVVRITANGSPFVNMAASGTVTAKLSKGVIGTTDVDLCSTIAIGAETVPTPDTAIDAVLSTTAGALDLLEGQHVFMTVAVSAHDCDVAGVVTIMMEWVPTDSP